MTPEPIRSDITFDVAVPEEAKTYKSAAVEVKPSNDTEYYYIGTMLRSEYETYREKKLLQELVGALNSQIGSGDDVNEFAKKMLYQGDGSYTLNYPSFYDEYVAIVFGCAVSEGSILSTTSVTAVPFSVDASLLPETPMICTNAGWANGPLRVRRPRRAGHPIRSTSRSSPMPSIRVSRSTDGDIRYMPIWWILPLLIPEATCG